MDEVDDRVEHLVYQVLHQAGVLPIDHDASLLRRYVIQGYFLQLADEPDLSRRELLIALTEAVMASRLHLGQPIAKSEQLKARRDLANWRQLPQSERDVLYLWAVVGLSEVQIVEKLGASGDWVEVTIAKLESLFERPLMNVSDTRRKN